MHWSVDKNARTRDLDTWPWILPNNDGSELAAVPWCLVTTNNRYSVLIKCSLFYFHVYPQRPRSLKNRIPSPWLGGTNQKTTGLIPCKSTYLRCEFHPPGGAYRRKPILWFLSHRCFSNLSPLLSLSKKHFKEKQYFISRDFIDVFYWGQNMVYFNIYWKTTEIYTECSKTAFFLNNL